jgi:PAS domain S-box-containing protein
VVDENDCVVRVSGEFSRMFGYGGDEVIGRPVNELIVPEHLRAEGESIPRAVVGGERVTMETARRHRDGRLIDVSVLATPIVVGGGAIGGYGIYRDISDRKAHERALAASEARYRALFDQSPVGVFLCDRSLRVTQYNRRLVEITGQPPEPPGELKVATLIPGLRRVRVDRPAVYGGPMRVVGSGERRWVAVRFAPLQDPDGTVIGGIGVVEDVTERERAGQELRARTAELARVNAQLRERTLELERAMKARNRLYSSMSHELRTPMSAILLYQELLLSGALGELAEEQREALDHSHTAAQHLLELVSDVLDLSKIEAGKLVVHPSPVTLPRLLRELLATVDPLAQHFGSSLELEIDAEFPAIVTDAQRVRQVLLNHVSNAVKFGRGRPVAVRIAQRGEEVCIEVEDQGVGIDPENLSEIFEDFVQVGSTQGGGTGLGLAISRHLARLLGGRLEVESEPDVGSTFRFFLPMAVAEAREREVVA